MVILEMEDVKARGWTEVAELVLRAQEGDREAFGRLVEQFQPTVHAIALRRLGNASEALELTQEVFLHVLRRIDQLREPERFAGWLRQVAVRMAINRATRRLAPPTVETGVLEGAFEQGDEPLDELITPRAGRAALGGPGPAQVARPRDPGRLLHPRPVAGRDRRASSTSRWAPSSGGCTRRGSG